MLILKPQKKFERSWFCECESSNCEMCSLGNFNGTIDINKIYDFIKNPPKMTIGKNITYTYK